MNFWPLNVSRDNVTSLPTNLRIVWLSFHQLWRTLCTSFVWISWLECELRLSCGISALNLYFSRLSVVVKYKRRSEKRANRQTDVGIASCGLLHLYRRGSGHLRHTHTQHSCYVVNVHQPTPKDCDLDLHVAGSPSGSSTVIMSVVKLFTQMCLVSVIN